MITLTDIAAEKIKHHLLKRGRGVGIRVGVKTTGCSGLAYILEYVDAPGTTDVHIQSQGCNIYVDQLSQVYLEGMCIDYQKSGLNEGFDFKNPNERDRCGCGESFRV